MKIAERITEKRIKAELSRNEVARRAELTEAYIGLLERGLRNPTVDVIERICGALGITIQEFFAVDQEIAAPPPDIYAFVNKRENHGVVRFISEMAAAGYNKEGIIKGLQSIRDIVEGLDERKVLGRKRVIFDDNIIEEEQKKLLADIVEKNTTK